jgi:hypothetical protein
MAGTAGAPRGVVVLVQGERRIVLGAIDGARRCDLALVDDLLRAQLVVQRLGWSLRITEVRPDLRELFELVGLTERLG